MSFNCTGQCTIDSFVRADPDESPFNKASILLRHASLWDWCCHYGTGTPFTESPLIEICSAKVRPRYFALHQHFTWVSGHHLYGSLRSDLNVERVVTAVWGSGDCSHSEYSIGVPSFRLTNSRDIRSTFFDRRALFGDNQCFR